ncbi:hypothetical protein [Undibacterium fentianense]|uniref:Uncharacterized protein n=1 Tax=Undibacterium fentianense TaxID=2828728 RepID=A0A941ID50_9BURK|nr:hypothetical protein [Undibacterium fentianense]MBR7800929.1 hypothetical protein [Undibacterium fentianense]
MTVDRKDFPSPDLAGVEYWVSMCGFVENLGFKVIPRVLTEPTFLPGLELGPNCIYVDFQRLRYPGDLLHEAGHLAVTTSEQRAAIGSDALVLPWPTDGEEIAAVLWSFAAARYLNIPLDVVFHADGYKQDSTWLIAQFERGEYIGLPFLQWAGLCFDPVQAEKQQALAFPVMQRWVRT